MSSSGGEARGRTGFRFSIPRGKWAAASAWPPRRGSSQVHVRRAACLGLAGDLRFFSACPSDSEGRSTGGTTRGTFRTRVICRRTSVASAPSVAESQVLGLIGEVLRRRSGFLALPSLVLEHANVLVAVDDLSGEGSVRAFSTGVSTEPLRLSANCNSIVR